MEETTTALDRFLSVLMLKMSVAVSIGCPWPLRRSRGWSVCYHHVGTYIWWCGLWLTMGQGSPNPQVFFQSICNQHVAAQRMLPPQYLKMERGKVKREMVRIDMIPWQWRKGCFRQYSFTDTIGPPRPSQKVHLTGLKKNRQVLLIQVPTMGHRRHYIWNPCQIMC